MPNEEEKNAAQQIDLTTEATQKNAAQQIDLTTEATLVLSLAAERIQSADTLLKLRQTEMQAALAALTNEYSEDGKYRVTEVNMEKRKVSRVLKEVGASS